MALAFLIPGMSGICIIMGIVVKENVISCKYFLAIFVCDGCDLVDALDI